MIPRLKWLGKSLVSNFHLKATSVLLACLLWGAINGEPQSVAVFKVPLIFRNYPKGIEVTGDTINTLDVRVTASASIVKRIDTADISAYVDLSDWSLGERTYPISSQNVIVPYGVRIVRIIPNQIKLNFQRIGNKVVEIQPRLVGILPRGYQITTVVCRPSAVQIAGPEAQLKVISHLSTESISITGQKAPYQAKVHISLDDPLLQLADDPEINVDITIVALPARGK